MWARIVFPSHDEDNGRRKTLAVVKHLSCRFLVTHLVSISTIILRRWLTVGYYPDFDCHGGGGGGDVLTDRRYGFPASDPEDTTTATRLRTSDDSSLRHQGNQSK
jgi:hypothetical protein